MAATSTREALVLGSTGLIGLELTRLLVDSPTYAAVHAPVRRAGKFSHAKLNYVPFDFDQMEKLSSLLNSEKWKRADVFCCLGTTIKVAGSEAAFEKVDLVYPTQAARAASLSGAPRFLLVTSVGADAQSRIFYNRTKGRVEENIRALNFQATHILRPSLLRGKREESRPGEVLADLAAGVFSFALVGGLRRYRPIEARAVAAAMLALALGDERGTHIHESEKIQELADQSLKK